MKKVKKHNSCCVFSIKRRAIIFRMVMERPLENLRGVKKRRREGRSWDTRVRPRVQAPFYIIQFHAWIPPFVGADAIVLYYACTPIYTKSGNEATFELHTVYALYTHTCSALTHLHTYTMDVEPKRGSRVINRCIHFALTDRLIRQIIWRKIV